MFSPESVSLSEFGFYSLMCIDIMEILFRIANGQISSIFYSYQPAT